MRTVTVEAQPATAGHEHGRRRPSPPRPRTSGAALNDQGFRLLQAGNAAAALPLLERAVSALQGSGSVTEAYALVQPRPRPLLDRRLHRRQGPAGRVGADPGEAPRDQAARARRRQGLQALSRRCETGFRRGAAYPETWPFALLSSSSPFAASCSAPLPSCCASSTTEPSCRWPSSSTSTPAGRRCTSTARSCGRSSRSGRRACAAATDALIAIEELQREPAAAIFARAHAGPRPSEDEALFRTVLLGLLVSTAEACGGFDWDDDSFDRAYAELERSLFGERRTYTAVAPLVGVSVATQLELAPGLRVRAVADGELARHWPEASSMVPKDFGRETDRYCVLELRAALAGAEDPPDAPAEIADAVSAIRLATAAPLSAGPVLFETLDGRPYGIRPVLPIAATQPPGEATRLDSFRGALAGELLVRLGLADADSALAEALDRWELSLFQNEPFRSEQLRAGFSRCSGRRGRCGRPCCSRQSPAPPALHAELTGLAGGEPAAPRLWMLPGGRSSRRCSTATGRRCCGSSTRHCSACASGGRSTSSPDHGPRLVAGRAPS